MTAATKEMTGQQVTAVQSTAARLQRYDRPGPRYTSYPTAVEFSDRFDEAACHAMQTGSPSGQEPAVHDKTHRDPSRPSTSGMRDALSRPTAMPAARTTFTATPNS